MTTTYLLDANVLIALVVAEHEHHKIAAGWASQHSTLALCPFVEGALFRFLIRTGAGTAAASVVLSEVYASSRCEFWGDSISYARADLDHVVGHRQVTDAYLAALAANRGGRLATFDRALSQELPEVTELITA